MKGREALSEIQQFLEHVIIRCFTIKYTLLPKRKEAVAPNEMEIWNLYKSQETYFRGTHLLILTSLSAWPFECKLRKDTAISNILLFISKSKTENMEK